MRSESKQVYRPHTPCCHSCTALFHKRPSRTCPIEVSLKNTKKAFRTPSSSHLKGRSRSLCCYTHRSTSNALATSPTMSRTAGEIEIHRLEMEAAKARVEAPIAQIYYDANICVVLLKRQLLGSTTMLTHVWFCCPYCLHAASTIPYDASRTSVCCLITNSHFHSARSIHSSCIVDSNLQIHVCVTKL